MATKKEAERIVREAVERHGTRDHVRWLDEECSYCGRQLNSWDERIAKALLIGFNMCESCVATEEYGMTVDALRAKMLEKFGMEPCQGL